MRLVRLTLNDRTDEWADMYLDVFVQEDAIISGQVLTYGRWGKLGDDPWPFTFRYRTGAGEAHVDFGTDLGKGRERFGTLNLVGEPLRRGELTTFVYAGNVICFSVREAKMVPSLEDYFLSA